MALPKKVAMGLVALVLTVSIIMFIIVPADDGDNNQNTSILGENDDILGINDDDGDTDIDSEATYEGNINVDGILTLPNNQVTMDEQRLADNHRSVISENSVEITFEGDDVTLTATQFGSLIEMVEESESGVASKYSDGEMTFEFEEFAGENIYDVESSTIDETNIHRHNLISSILQNLELTSFEEHPDGYELQMEGEDNLTDIENVLGETEISAAEVTLVINNNGVFTNLDINLIGTDILGFPTTSEYKYNIENIGGVDIQEPLWVSEARSSVALIDNQTESNRNWIMLEHRGLSDIPAGSEISLLPSQGESFETTIDQPITEGDVIYLYPLSLAAWSYSVNEEPSQDGQINIDSGEFFVTIGSDLGTEDEELYYSETIVP